MQITHSFNTTTYNAVFSGIFNYDDRSGFREVLDNIAEKKISKIVFHMEEVTFVDSAALGMLLLALDEAKKGNKEISIQGVTGQVKKILELSKFDVLFSIK